jgi:hypothetical protein
MDGHVDEALTDRRLDREIEALLVVEPSPQFTARARERVARVQMQAPWHGSVLRVGAAAAATAVVVIGMWRMPTPGPRVSERPPSAASRPDEAVTPSVAAHPRDEAAPPVPLSATPRPVRVETQPAEGPHAEIVISREDAAALQRLVDVLAARQLEPGVLPQLDSVSAPLAPIEEIVLEPITLSPIAGLDSE